MAHEVYQINGEASMAYAGDTPWHGIGQQLDADSPIEIWAQKAHLDWTVAMAPVQFFINNSWQSYNERSVIYREDSMAPLAVVSSDYKPVQPNQVLEFFRATVERAGFKIETAGSLKNGKRVWALANTGRELKLNGRDLVKAYLLLATSYDTTLRTTAAFTAVRVVCNNTLGFAYEQTERDDRAGSKSTIKVSHRSHFDAEQIHNKLGTLDNSWATFCESATALSKVSISEDDAARFFINLLHNKRMADDFSDVPKRTVASLLRIFGHGVGQDTDSARNTAWGLVNAVTRFYDHERSSRTQDNRLDTAWFGDGSLIKQRAWADALELSMAA